MSDIAIRAMTQADWPAVARIYQVGVETGVATLETAVPDYAAWDASHLPWPRLVAACGEDTVGWAALSPASARKVYAGVAEVSVYVAPGMHGQGIGRALLLALLDASRAAGLWTLQSSIIRQNEASLHLHTRCGFRIVGVRERLGRDQHGTWRDVVLMEKRNDIN